MGSLLDYFITLIYIVRLRYSMFKRTVSRFLIFAFASYGALWTVIDSLSSFVERLKPTGPLAYTCLIGTAAVIALWKAWPCSSIELRVPNSDSSVMIEFGDIFKKSGCIAIPVNEFFDSQLGDHVSPNSLHGQFIRDILGGQSSSFDALTQNALSSLPYEDVTRPNGRTRRYKIGTTATADINNKRFFFFALARTDVDTLKAIATIHELWDALAGLWETIRVKSNGNPVYMPLPGGGLSGVGLPPVNLLELLLISFFYYTKKNKIVGKITIVLHPSLRTEIDLLSLQKQRV